MPIAFAKVSVHSRSHGHSAVAGAAYRAGKKLLDARTGELHNFENRDDVLYENVMLPDGADAKFQDREILWNEVELAEKRKDAQVAKDVLLALPKEVSLDEQIELARNFAHTHFVSKGLAADIAIHNKQDGNPHAHIYITTRRIVGDRLDIKKARDLNPGFSRGGLVAEKDYWGEEWRDFQNGFFEEKGLTLTVDENHIVPQVHEGRVRGKEAYLKEENKLRREASVEIALNDPESLLNILATKKEVFSERDIANLIFKNTNTEVEYSQAYTGLKAHRDLIFLGYGEDGRERYTSTGNYLREVELSGHVDEMVLKNAHKVPNRTVSKTAKLYKLTEEQGMALEHIAESGKVCAVVGRAGTGKTYMLKAVHDMYLEEGYKLIGMAVAGVAAKNLEKDTGIKSYTIHSIKKRIGLGALKLSENDILVMDEAGMTDLNDMADIIFHAKQAGAKVILVGDHAQLQPVGKGAPFRTIVERAGFAEISQVMRQNDPGDSAATMLLSKGRIGEAIEHYNNKGQVKFLEDEMEAITGLVEAWKAHITKENLGKTVIAAFTNEEVNTLNEMARRELVAKEIVAAEGQRVTTEKGAITIARGDRILFLQNNKSIGVNNGDFATVTNIDGGMISAAIGETKVTFDAREYNNFYYGYAATVHKLQGSTLDDVFTYIGSKGWDRYLVYVALSRHKESVRVYVNQENHKDLVQLKENLSRYSFRDSILDWPLTYSLRRGFDPDSTVGRFVGKVLKIRESIKDKWLFVVNYEAYLNRVMHRERLEQNLKRREEARKVAAFVDMHRELGRKWSEMSKSLGEGEKIYQHPEYLATYEEMLVKNKIAFELNQEYQKYALAFAANNLSKEQLEKASKAYENFSRSRDYLEAVAASSPTLQKQAHEIQANSKEHYSALSYLTRKNDLEFWEVIGGIKDNALRHEHELQLGKLKGAEKEAFIMADRYYWLDKEVRGTWREVYKNGGLDSLSDGELKAIHQKTAECDKIAYEICKHPKLYDTGLQIYELDLDKLQGFSSRHLTRLKVVELLDSQGFKREEMAADVLADRRYYHHIHELELDWKELYKERGVYVHKQKLLGLTSEERHYYRTVIDYRKARVSAGMAWSKLIEDQGQGKEIPRLRQSLCWKLIETRNSLAYEIALDPKKYAPFLQDTNLKISDIEKHAVAYSRHLERQEEWQKNKYEHKGTAKHVPRPEFVKQDGKLGWDYQAINDALVGMGEAFYEKVLGFKGKKEGLQIAYREGHALLYSPSGPKAGSWHSFSDGEGGGPIQLLMSQEHGWGLTKEDACKEGAALAGLTDTQAQFSHKTPPRAQPARDIKKEQQEAEEREKRIAAARYYYNSAKPIEGTIGETYLREIRGIEGDISFVKYHPRIRDSKAVETDNKQITSGKHETEYVVTYHPGIVVAAYNRDGELTGGQTIILNPKTCDKVEKETVGAVKRSRGVVKGSAVQVQQGSSSKVIIAEGNETALSLIKAEPDANIYVTLGNIKNAASLEWLSEKHHTREFYFAADNDGHDANNIKALREVAKELKYTKDIDCYMALPHLEGREKTDFNDVLREKGQKEVARQLADMKLIKVPERKTIVHGEELRERLQSELGNNVSSVQQKSAEKQDKELSPQKPTEAFDEKKLEWDKLAEIKNMSLEIILRYRHVASKRKSKEKDELNEPVIEQILELNKRPKTMEKIREAAPNIANYFAKFKEEKTPELTIDWKKDEYKGDWEKLRELSTKMKEGPLTYLVSLYNSACKKSEPHDIKRIYGYMNDIIDGLKENKGLFKKISEASPLLGGLFNRQIKAQEMIRARSRGRSR